MLGYAIVMKKKWVDPNDKQSKKCPQPFIVTCCKFTLDSIIEKEKINMKAYRRLRIPITLPKV